MDHTASLQSSGCYLYELLLHYQKSSNQDITAIKEELYRVERDRILREQVPPGDFRLFHFADTASTLPALLDVQAKMNEKKQQDAKDVFLCVEESKAYLEELFSLFKYTPETFTKCRECGYVSKSTNLQTAKCVMYFELPEDRQLTMAQYVAKRLNQPVIRCVNNN